MDISRRTFIVPLVILAICAGMLGFVVTRQVAPQPPDGRAVVSVVALPSTPTPAPTDPPPSTAPPEQDGGGGTEDEVDCPSGCECTRPNPGGIVIICR